MLGVTVWRRLLGVDDRTVIERVEFDEEADAVVAHLHARRLRKHRCGRCGRRAPGYDQGEGRRRWQALGLGEVGSLLEAEAPRVDSATLRRNRGAGRERPVQDSMQPRRLTFACDLGRDRLAALFSDGSVVQDVQDGWSWQAPCLAAR